MPFGEVTHSEPDDHDCRVISAEDNVFVIIALGFVIAAFQKILKKGE